MGLLPNHRINTGDRARVHRADKRGNADAEDYDRDDQFDQGKPFNNPDSARGRASYSTPYYTVVGAAPSPRFFIPVHGQIRYWPQL
jgi:hypothetical protein